MTEAEWLACEQVSTLLSCATRTKSWRKVTLFHVACGCSLLAGWEDGHPIWDSVAAVEAYVDDPLTHEEGRERLFENQRQSLAKLWQLIQSAGGVRTADVLNASAQVLPGLLLSATFEEGTEDQGYWWQWGDVTANGLMAEQIALTWKRVEHVCDAHLPLFHDIFGNPFRPVAFSLSWRTDTVVSLAAQMYDSRDFSTMPILADALQDAGCDSVEILDHCRGDGPHVRGCWVVDSVLGKE